jgi:hypothetical protein
MYNADDLFLFEFYVLSLYQNCLVKVRYVLYCLKNHTFLECGWSYIKKYSSTGLTEQDHILKSSYLGLETKFLESGTTISPFFDSPSNETNPNNIGHELWGYLDF